ncbi:MAG: NAD(P)-binding domain-containing protein [Microthrixaceae bacterium]
MADAHDLIVIGGNAGGLSAAVFARQSGLQRVTVLERGSTLALPGVAGEHGLDVGYGETVTSIEPQGDDLVVSTRRQSYRGRAVLVALRTNVEGWEAPIPVTDGDRVHVDTIPSPANDVDVLVVGHTDHAVELTVRLADLGAGVVLAAGGMRPGRLSPVGAQLLNDLERERRATLLYSSSPEQIAQVDGFPMAYFNDRRTPDLQFDHVVFSSGRRSVTPEHVGASDAALATGRVWFLGTDEETPATAPSAPGHSIGRALVTAVFPGATVPEPTPSARARQDVPGAAEELRTRHYNATITHFSPPTPTCGYCGSDPTTGRCRTFPGSMRRSASATGRTAPTTPSRRTSTRSGTSSSAVPIRSATGYSTSTATSRTRPPRTNSSSTSCSSPPHPTTSPASHLAWP